MTKTEFCVAVIAKCFSSGTKICYFYSKSDVDQFYLYTETFKFNIVKEN